MLGAYGPDVNPHSWYDSPRVPRVAANIDAALARLDPPDATVFAAKPGGLRRLAAARPGRDRVHPPPVPGRAAAGVSRLPARNAWPSRNDETLS